MAQEKTGSGWRVFQTSNHDKLSDALQEAANVVSGVELLEPTSFVRVVHQYDMTDGTHDVLVICEGD